MKETETVSCIGCGAAVPSTDGPTHAYIGASPGCWACYGQVLTKEYSDYRFAPVHRLTVDTYAVQHPGKPERRAMMRRWRSSKEKQISNSPTGASTIEPLQRNYISNSAPKFLPMR